MRKQIVVWSLMACCTLGLLQAKPIVFAEQPSSSTPVVCADEACFIAQYSDENRLPETQLHTFFAQAEKKDSIVRAISRPGTARPWYEFARNNASNDRIWQGRAFFRENRAVLDEVEARYGVDAAVIVAILGIETRYGRHSGSFRVGDALYTLSFFYPKRAEFFQQELQEFLLFSNELGRNPLDFTGSYAGAMGMPQFMPSSYRKWAVDFDGDGFADIWQNHGDIIASVANYLLAHGWQTGGQISVPVALQPNPTLLAIMDEKTALTRTVGDFRNLGVIVPSDIADNEPAVLYALESAPEQFDYYLGFNNFYAVWQYNHSRMYVHAVHDIAEGVRSGSLK